MSNEKCPLEEERVAIYGILKGILEKWRAELKPEDGGLLETVVLSPTQRDQSATALRLEDLKEEAIAATVILPTRERSSTSPDLPPASGLNLKVDDSEREGLPEKEECLEETVILKPQKPQGKRND